MDQQPAPQMMWGLITSHAIARCLHLVGEFGVADALNGKPASAQELAAGTGMNADALERMLRLLTAHGVFDSTPQGYVHTEASRLLRADHPQSMRAFARMVGMPAMWRAFTELDTTARTGTPATDWAALVDYFSKHPRESNLFNEAMAVKSGSIVPAVVAAYDFSRFGTVADIGGGRGHMLKGVLDRYPGTSGILFDLPHVIADAGAAKSERLQRVAGSFFDDPLPVADAYVMMEILHDWKDREALQILAAIRRAAPSHARLLIVEVVIAETPGPHLGKTLDVIMLAITGGRERTRSEYQKLLETAGFRLERVVETPSQSSIVEATIAEST
jgi:hypothetical protein